MVATEINNVRVKFNISYADINENGYLEAFNWKEDATVVVYDTTSKLVALKFRFVLH